jgi:hydroxymethylpyrimidine pyrophosphatase-like HAD family hydrolase
VQFTTPIKAVVIDIDGCLTPKSFGKALDLNILQQIQEISKNKANDPAYPMLILNTGRDITHTELMAKVLDAFHYFIVEMGAAVISVHGAQFIYKTHPDITPESLATLHQLQDKFLKQYPIYQKYLQFGKRYMFTFLFENGDPVLQQCATDLRAFFQTEKSNFHLDIGHNFLNIVFPRVNKGDGMKLLFQANPELSEKNMAGIGDSTGDWDFLKMCAFSACPANASDFLKQNCHFTSQYTEAEGTLEILNYIIKRNRVLIKNLKKFQKKPSKPITAIIIDVNGTIDTASYGKPMDLDQMKKVRALIQQGKKDNSIPKIILNTGWDLNYTTLYAQILNDFQYHIIERGAAIISIDGPHIYTTVDPTITEEMIDQLARIQTGFIAQHPHYNRFLQVGKKYMMSFQFEVGALEQEECVADLTAYLKSQNVTYDIESGHNYINMSFPGINKGSGAALLIKLEKDLEFETTLGIGDSNGDWDYMKLCGFTACPSNASAFLKSHCDLIASKPESQGVLEILDQIIQWNLELKMAEKISQ